MCCSIILSLALAGFVAAYDTQSRLNKQNLAYNFTYFQDGIEKNAEHHLKYVRIWNNGYILQQCKDIAKSFNLNHIEVFDVLYDNCQNDPWVFCRHKSVNPTIHQLADQFGRLPVGMRQWVRHFIALPADGGSAFFIGQSITFLRPTTDMISTIMHEAVHAMDFGGAYGSQLSNQDDWWNNYNQDSRVPDVYAQKNQAENVTQNTVVSWFNKNVPNGLGGVEPNWRLIFHQYATLQYKAGNLIIKGPDNGDAQCTHRFTASQPVPRNSKRAMRSMRSIRPVPKVALSESVKELMSKRTDDLHYHCTLSW